VEGAGWDAQDGERESKVGEREREKKKLRLHSCKLTFIMLPKSLLVNGREERH
jgi:hypothetical protein